jgi:hypothetical protein
MDVTIDCLCPKKGEAVRHPKGDTVTLRDRLDFHGATTTQKAIGQMYREDGEASDAELTALLVEHYLLFGIEAWTLRDADDKPLTLTRAAIREHILPHSSVAWAISDAADSLYQSQVMLPLMERVQRYLRDSQTAESTSPTSGEPPEPPRPLKRSSTSTTRTGATATITSSLDGDSNSSQSSASAA